MRKTSRAIWSAGLMVLGLAGCNGLTSTVQRDASVFAEAILPAVTFTALAADGHIYYSASVDTTAVSVQKLLQDLGLNVTVTRTSDGAVRIASALPDGARFTLVVNSVQPPGEGMKRTQVYVDWDNAADGKRGFQVLAELEIQKRKPTTSSK